MHRAGRGRPARRSRRIASTRVRLDTAELRALGRICKVSGGGDPAAVEGKRASSVPSSGPIQEERVTT